MPTTYTSFEHVQALRATGRALLVRFCDGDEVWVPKSLIGPDSEVEEPGDEGDLSVAEWWADEKELS